MAGPLRLTPNGKQYHFEGKTTTGNMVAGMTGLFTLSGVPKHSELESGSLILPGNERTTEIAGNEAIRPRHSCHRTHRNADPLLVSNPIPGQEKGNAQPADLSVRVWIDH
jgi:hypothetical protein